MLSERLPRGHSRLQGLGRVDRQGPAAFRGGYPRPEPRYVRAARWLRQVHGQLESHDVT